MLELAEQDNCRGIDLSFLFLINKLSKTVYEMHVLGQDKPVEIHGGFSLKLCYGCFSTPESTYKVSGFSLTRFGRDSEMIVFVDRQITVSVYSDGTEVFKVKDLGTRPVIQGGVDLFGNDKKPRDKPDQESGGGGVAGETKKCEEIEKFKAAECKKAGCEYLVDSGECNTADIGEFSIKY